MQYYAYLLQDRECFFFLYFGRLLHQFAVDMWVKVEQNHLRYLCENQSELRVALLNGLMDSINGESSRAMGRHIILPATFIGSPRDMNSRYQDSMAIVRSLGKPDLFITFTCNPQWTEITRELKPGQTAADRPDLTARVFKLKVRIKPNKMLLSI